MTMPSRPARPVVTPIIQFGTSRFLQAHADLFISDAAAEGQKAGPITVVQTTGDAGRAGRLEAFDGRPIPIVVRGLADGKPVERTEYTRSIVRGLSAARDWDEVRRVFVEEADYAISNTGDTGYRDARRRNDRGRRPGIVSGEAHEAALSALGRDRRADHALPVRADQRERRGAPRGCARGSRRVRRHRPPSSPGCARTASGRTAWSTASSRRRSSRPARSPSPTRCGRSSGRTGSSSPAATRRSTSSTISRPPSG